jgi:hypothetical protein
MYFNFIQANFHVSILSNLVTFTPYNSCLLDVHHALPSVHSQMHEISTFDHMDSKCKSRHAKNQSRGANFTNCWDLRDHTMNLTLNLIASWPTYANYITLHPLRVETYSCGYGIYESGQGHLPISPKAQLELL